MQAKIQVKNFKLRDLSIISGVEKCRATPGKIKDRLSQVPRPTRKVKKTFIKVGFATQNRRKRRLRAMTAV
jgi:hypothetical protein